MYLMVSPYQEILEGITTSLQISEGIIKLTGRDGTGKSAVCLQLFRQLDADKKKVLYFLTPPRTAEKLQNQILQYLDIKGGNNFTKTLTNHLLAKPRDKRLLYLIFDDAQLIDDVTFASIRMLSNIQDDTQTLVKLIVCGNTQLDERLTDISFRSVAQYISQSFTIPSMTTEQVKEFYWSWWREQNIEVPPPGSKIIANLFKQTKGMPGPVLTYLDQAKAKLIIADAPAATETKTEAAHAPKRSPHTEPVANTIPAPAKPARKGNTEQALGYFFLILFLGLGGFMYYLYSRVDEDGSMRLSDMTSSVTTAFTSLTNRTTEPEAATNTIQVTETESAPAVNITQEPVLETEQVSEAVTELAKNVEPVLAATSSLATETQTDDTTTTSQSLSEANTAMNADLVVADPVETAEDISPELVVVEDNSADAVQLAANDSMPAGMAEAVTPDTGNEAETKTVDVEINNFLASWIDSWVGKNLDGYFAHYVADFDSLYQDTHEEWVEQRTRSISRASELGITWDMLEVTQTGDDSITLRFWLYYLASNYGDNTWKELELTRQDGALLIKNERNLRIERTR